MSLKYYNEYVQEMEQKKIRIDPLKKIKSRLCENNHFCCFYFVLFIVQAWTTIRQKNTKKIPKQQICLNDHWRNTWLRQTTYNKHCVQTHTEFSEKGTHLLPVSQVIESVKDSSCHLFHVGLWST